MKNWDNLVVTLPSQRVHSTTDKFNILCECRECLALTGRGVVLIVDFIKSGLCTEVWEKELPKVHVGDTILYEGVTYIIRAVDVSRNTFNGGLMTRIGVLV